MIKIEHPDLDIIAKKYFEDVKEQIKHKCLFLQTLLDVIYNGTNRTELRAHKCLHWKTKIALCNFLKAKKKIASEKQYSKLHKSSVHNWVNLNKAVLRNIIVDLNNDTNLERIILCKPDDALKTEKELFTRLNLANPLDEHIKTFVNRIIDYSQFDNYAYKIATALNVNTCPYCNRNYINTVIDKKGQNVIRPTFDHFFPKSEHPFLALSFYNLIPSCYYCNSSLKNSKDISIDTHIHPYKEGFDQDVTFHILISNLKQNKSDPENYTLLFVDNMNPLSPNDRYRKIFGGVRGTKTPQEGNINLFKLEDIYQSHLDIVGELVVKCDKLSSSYAKSLQPFFSSLGTSRDEFYQYYFGNYFNEKDFHRRPMAKLSKDVVSQIMPNFVI